MLRNILDVEPRKAGDVNPQLSPFFEEVVQTLTAEDRDERFASASDLVAILEQGEKSDWWKERATRASAWRSASPGAFARMTCWTASAS